MLSTKPTTVSGLLEYALRTGLIKGGEVDLVGKYHLLEEFATGVITVAAVETAGREEAFKEERMERRIAREAGILDEGQDDSGSEASTGSGVRDRLADVLANYDAAASEPDVATCFSLLCKHMGVSVAAHCSSVSGLGGGAVALLRQSKVMIGFTVYSDDDPRNHVIPVLPGTKSATVNFVVDGGNGKHDCMHGVTSPQEFFDSHGRFYNTSFYMDDGSGTDPQEVVGMSGTGFGADSGAPGPALSAGYNGGGRAAGRTGTVFPPAPVSIVEHDTRPGSANTSNGVVRPKKRVIQARGGYEVNIAALKNYTVTGVTMFNNVEEMYLDRVSRSMAQEIIEDLFNVWAVPMDEAQSVTYAEDLLWAFLVARTASNKADYNVAFDVPTAKGSVEADFSRLSMMLADKYGITRRNFARGVADDLRAFINRPENQFIKSRSAARIYADPQYGHLSFDGSTGCSGMTSSEQRFTKLLEDRNLYERDDIRAQGASDMLMQGIHGGSRSVVAR